MASIAGQYKWIQMGSMKPAGQQSAVQVNKKTNQHWKFNFNDVGLSEDRLQSPIAALKMTIVLGYTQLSDTPIVPIKANHLQKATVHSYSK